MRADSRTRRHATAATVALLAVSVDGGCETYRAMPARDEVITTAMAPRQPEELARAATSLQHPLLPPITIGTDGTLTPQGAAVVAVLQHPALRAARSRRGVAAAQLLQAGILPNPQLSAGMDFPVAGATEGTVNGFSLGATWDVTSLVGLAQAQRAAAHEADAVDLEVAWQEWQAAMGAKLHATRVAWLSLQRDELLRQVQKAAELENLAAASVQSGLMTLVEGEAAGALLQKRRSALLSTESSLVAETGLLLQSLGLPQQARIIVLTDPDDNLARPPSPADVGRLIRSHRLDLAALRAGYASQEARLYGAVLSQFPKIGLGITRARDTSDVGTIGFGITLDLPIFDRGQGRIALERASRQVLFDELVARTFEAGSDAGRALAELAAARPQLEESRRTAARLRALADRLSEARARGDTDLNQLTMARNDAADADLEILRLQLQEAELRIAVEVATGALIGGYVQ